MCVCVCVCACILCCYEKQKLFLLNVGVHNCPQDWLTHGDYCYQLNNHPVQRFTWGAARNSCLDFNLRWRKEFNVAQADLVSIVSSDEQKMLYNALLYNGLPMEENFFWTGLKQKNEMWSWTDRSKFQYQNWKSADIAELQEPICVKASLTSVHGGWVTANCSEKHIFVCKVKRGLLYKIFLLSHV